MELILSPRTESVVWLRNTDPANPSNNPPKRRMSVSGQGLYSVNNQVRETGFDYLPKVPKTVASNSGIMAVQVVASTSTSGMNNSLAAQAGVITPTSTSTSGDIETDIDTDIEISHTFAEQSEPSTEASPAKKLCLDSVAVNAPNARLQLHNHFNPFLRMPNQPFGTKRNRAISVDSAQPPIAIDLSGPLYPYNNSSIRRRLSIEGTPMLSTLTEIGNSVSSVISASLEAEANDDEADSSGIGGNSTLHSI